MLVSMHTDKLIYRFGIRETIQLLHDAGFDAYDITLYGKTSNIFNEYFMDNDYIQKANNLRSFADSIGIVCNQSHAPFYSHKKIEEGSLEFNNIIKAMEIASILGAKNIVIHPLKYLDYVENAKFLKEENLHFYSELIPYAKKFGIRILTENMWQRNTIKNNIVKSVCSTPEEFCEYVDMLNSEHFKGCLDLGHTALVGIETDAFIKALGKERLFGLHVHDNDFISDLHTMPFTSKIDFHAITDALAEIGYEGDLTFESGHYFNKFPDELILSAARHMCEVGKYLVKQIERKKS